MYLDDMIVVSKTHQQAATDFDFVRKFIHDLGLPEARDKVQPPSQRVKWLGVIFDSNHMSVSLTQDKIDDTLASISGIYKSEYISLKVFQSVLGKMLNIAKCVKPARIFVVRMLATLRKSDFISIFIDEHFRADLDWFLEFIPQWRGYCVITPSLPTRSVAVDASMKGLGGADEIGRASCRERV